MTRLWLPLWIFRKKHVTWTLKRCVDFRLSSFPDSRPSKSVRPTLEKSVRWSSRKLEAKRNPSPSSIVSWTTTKGRAVLGSSPTPIPIQAHPLATAVRFKVHPLATEVPFRRLQPATGHQLKHHPLVMEAQFKLQCQPINLFHLPKDPCPSNLERSTISLRMVSELGGFRFRQLFESNTKFPLIKSHFPCYIIILSLFIGMTKFERVCLFSYIWRKIGYT